MSTGIAHFVKLPITKRALELEIYATSVFSNAVVDRLEIGLISLNKTLCNFQNQNEYSLLKSFYPGVTFKNLIKTDNKFQFKNAYPVFSNKILIAFGTIETLVFTWYFNQHVVRLRR